MVIETIKVILRAWNPSGEIVPRNVFFDKLVIVPGDSVNKYQPGQSANVEFLSLAFSDYRDAGEPSEAFAKELEKRLVDAAHWLEKQPKPLFDALRQDGLVTDVFISAFIDSNQMDLDLPQESLRSCAECGLKISIVTND